MSADPVGDEDALWRELRRPGSADRVRERLFMRHADFAAAIARRYSRRSGCDIELGDLRQLAYAGLLEAIDRFDLTRGVPFRGYASRRIVGSIVTGMIPMSERREQLAWKARIERERIGSIAGENARAGRSTIEQLAELAVGLALGFMLEGTSLFVDEAPGVSTAGATNRLGAYDSAAWCELLGRMRIEVARLPERERSVIEEHYLADMGFDQVADLLSLSRGRISQLHREALGRLAKRLAGAGHRGYDREGHRSG